MNEETESIQRKAGRQWNHQMNQAPIVRKQFMKKNNSVKSASLTATVFVMMLIIATFFSVSTPSAQAQGVVTTQAQFDTSMNNALWSLTWGTDGEIIAKTNGVTAGWNSNPILPGGIPFTSDTWTLSLLIGGGDVTISATSANFPGLSWNSSYLLSSSAPVTSLLFGANYNADNNESLTIGSVSINNVPISGTATVNGSQDFAGMMINFASPITSLNYTLNFSTPSTWERDNGSQSSLLSSLAIPGSTVVPEPTTLALASLGGLSLLLFRRRK